MDRKKERSWGNQATEENVVKAWCYLETLTVGDAAIENSTSSIPVWFSNGRRVVIIPLTHPTW